MKIITWNVNGYRAILKKGFWDWFIESEADILCLQEIKAKSEQIPPQFLNLEGYTSYLNSAQRPGYSGVMTFSKRPPIDVQFGLGIEKFDLEGRVVATIFPDFDLYNIYFPNGQRDSERVKFKLEFYEELLRQCQEKIKAGRQIFICGDFNTAHREIDLANPQDNIETSGFLPEEREWIGRFLEAGFLDVYRNLYPDKIQYTWWPYRFKGKIRNLGWRIDLILATQNIASKVRDITIQDKIEMSDHCPVTLEITE